MVGISIEDALMQVLRFLGALRFDVIRAAGRQFVN